MAPRKLSIYRIIFILSLSRASTLSQFLAMMSAMNFLSNILLLAVCCAPSVSAVGGRYVADSGDNERSMIGNVDIDDLADIAQEKEMLRDISIPQV